MATTEPPFDIEQLWEQLGKTTTPAALNPTQFEQLRENSNSPLQQLRRAVRINSGYTILVALLWTGLLIYLPVFWIRFIIGLIVGAHLLALGYNSYLLRKVLPTPSVDLSINARLKQLHLRMQQALRGTEYFALFFYPLSMTVGFTFALHQADKLHLLSESTELQLLLLGAMVVIVPCCFLLTRWLHKLAYGKHLKQLAALIAEFETEEDNGQR